MIRRGPRGYGFTLRAIRVYYGDSEYYTLHHLVVVRSCELAAYCFLKVLLLLVNFVGYMIYCRFPSGIAILLAYCFCLLLVGMQAN